MVLSVTGVRKSYGQVAVLRGIDFQISPGQIVGLLGLNGAGKSTLVAIIAGLLHPDAGQVQVAGYDVRRQPAQARAALGLAPQQLGIYPAATIRQNLVLFGELAGLRRHRLRRRIDQLAQALELTELLDRRGRELSGGEQRRLHTAMALLHQPRLLLLDEPTVGVDVATRQRLLEFVSELARQGTAVCYSTHYLAEIETLGGDVAILHDGAFVRQGSVAQLLAASGDSWVKLTLECDPPPDFDFGAGARREGRTILIPSQEPAQTAAATLVSLGQWGALVRSIEFVRPSLESVFLTVTGRLPAADPERVAA